MELFCWTTVKQIVILGQFTALFSYLPSSVRNKVQQKQTSNLALAEVLKPKAIEQHERINFYQTPKYSKTTSAPTVSPPEVRNGGNTAEAYGPEMLLRLMRSNRGVLQLRYGCIDLRLLPGAVLSNTLNSLW